MGDVSKNVEAYLAIKELMSADKLFPGQKIVYRDLEETLGMSKTPIINALMKLEQEGLMDSKRNCGFYVRRTSLQDMSQIFELREKLEEMSLDFAIHHHKGREDLKLLSERLANYLSYSSKVYDRKRAELDIEFHMQIAVLGKNKFLISIIRQFYEQMYFKIHFSLLTPYIEQFKKEHRLLVSAIRNRDLKGARKIIHSHHGVGKKAFQVVISK